MLERALQHHGDNLYRLALLLTPDAAAADAALLRMARQLTVFPGDQAEEATLLAALIAALPPEPRSVRRLPAWASADSHRPEARLLAAIARLPRQQRLALALAIVQPGTANETVQERTTEQREAFRDALLALAQAADQPNLAAAMLDQNAPDECRAARTALALDDPALHHNPAVRGHLALCDDCRAVSQSWQLVASRTEDALRTALRLMHMPEPLVQHMIAATQPKHPTPLRSVLISPWTRRALLPIVVLLVIAALIWPRSDPNPSPVTRTGAAPADLRTLVQTAQTNLYTTPATGIWHSRYVLRWTFADGSYAPLIGDLWTDSQSGRSRIQLTHESGGGPYEFMLGDGKALLWYATTPAYGESVYPLFFDPRRARVQLTLDQANQKQAIANRLRSGAWALPEAYLRQAVTSELQSWGRQASSDGTQLEVVGFTGVSALASQPNVPGGPADRITILLLINPNDGRLQEIRELIGPTGGDQISRTTWNNLGAEQITNEASAERVFQLRSAWNGTGIFPRDAEPGMQPRLPLLDPATFVSPAFAIEYPRLASTEFPAAPPPGAEYAAFITVNDADSQAVIYVGGGRSITILGQPDNVANQASFSTDGPIEQATLAGRSALIRRNSADSYSVLLRPAPNTRRRSLLQVQAHGYTHDELLAVLQTLGPLTVDRYQAQIGLFAAKAIDSQAQALLLNALAATPKLEAGQARHVVARIYMRQNTTPEDLPDPYHLPAYGGRPPDVISERWTIGADSPEPHPNNNTNAITQTDGIRIFTRISNGSGQVYQTSYSDAARVWRYYTARQTVEQIDPENNRYRDDPARSIALRMLTCGGRLASIPGGQAITYTENDWLNQQACVRWGYGSSTWVQQLPRWSSDRPFSVDDTPYLADLISEPQITTFIQLDKGGRINTIETRLGTALDGMLIESWQLERDEIIPIAQMPPELTRTPPAVLFEIPAERSTPPRPIIFQPTTITESLQLIRSPLLVPPASTETSWFASRSIGRGGPPFTNAATPFDEALWRGMAIQLEVQINNRTTSKRETQYIYQGAAHTFGDLLRANATWQGSSPTTVALGEQELPGWQVITSRGVWVLVEVQGSLIAFPDGLPMREFVQSMQIISPPKL